MASHMCLVLNKSYVPVETISWQNAFTKIFNGRAYAIEYYDDEIVHTPNDEYLKPAVIVCTEYNGQLKKIPIYSKRLVCQRDEWTCAYCGDIVSSETCSIDHVLPRSKGGRSTYENTVCACKPCNYKKADRTPSQARMRLRIKPAKPTINPIKHKFGNRQLADEWVQYVECHF